MVEMWGVARLPFVVSATGPPVTTFVFFKFGINVPTFKRSSSSSGFNTFNAMLLSPSYRVAANSTTCFGLLL